jgi:predicted MFS family arabinose efflux permease
LLAAFGAGAIIGSVAAARAARRIPITRIAVAGKAGQVVAFAALIPLWPAAGLVVVAAALGIFNGLINGPVGAVRLARIRPAARAKALTAIGTVTWLGGIAGLIGAGPTLDATSPMTLFIALAILQAASVSLFSFGVTSPTPAQPD